MTITQIETISEAELVKSKLFAQREWNVAIETTGSDPLVHHIKRLYLESQTDQIAVKGSQGCLMAIRSWLEDPRAKKYVIDGKFFYKMLRATLGIEVEGLQCLSLADKILGESVGSVSEVVKQIEQTGQQGVWDLENAVLPAVGDMELGGTRIDEEVWRAAFKIQEDSALIAKKKLDVFAAQFFETDDFGVPSINYQSSSQVIRLLRHLRVMIPKIDPNGKEQLVQVTCTDKDSLMSVANEPVVQSLLKLRSANMLMSTFGETFLNAVHPVTGRIHFMVDQMGARTGRFTSHKKSPVNMLNIPKKGLYRGAFSGGEGMVTEAHDYDAFELRIWAELSGDPFLKEAFAKGVDVHSYLASNLFRLTVSKTENPHLRLMVKELVFGIIYGMSAKTLYFKLRANNQGVTYALTQQLYFEFCRLLKVGMGFVGDCGRTAAQSGQLRLASGRMRKWDVGHLLRSEIHTIEKQGMNFPIQATGAEIIKTAMIKVRRFRRATGIQSEFFNQVYDELNTFTAVDQSMGFSASKKSLMVEAGEEYVKSVPMVVTSVVGDHWGSMTGPI
jgi:DNA polymerase-1